MTPRWILAAVLLLPACAQHEGPMPVATGPTYTITYAADPITTADQARQAAFGQGATQCQGMGKRFELVEDQVDWPRTPAGGAATGGTLRFRCF
jgi:hypothetical protein